MAENEKAKRVADKVVKKASGKELVEVAIKRGTVQYWKYSDKATLDKEQKAEKIVNNWNRQERTDVVNVGNRVYESKVTPEIRALKKLSASLSDEKVKAQLEVDIKKLLATYEPK